MSETTHDHTECTAQSCSFMREYLTFRSALEEAAAILARGTEYNAAYDVIADLQTALSEALPLLTNTTCSCVTGTSASAVGTCPGYCCVRGANLQCDRCLDANCPCSQTAGGAPHDWKRCEICLNPDGLDGCPCPAHPLDPDATAPVHPGHPGPGESAGA